MTTTERQPGLSEFEQQMYDHLLNHVRIEDEVLQGYAALADSVKAGYVRFLLDLIGEDEHRHHGLFLQWADTIKAMGRLEEGSIPVITRTPEAAELIPMFEAFIKTEHDDLKELKALSKEVKDFKDTTLWELLIEMMELDTQKHIKILTFLRDHTES